MLFLARSLNKKILDILLAEDAGPPKDNSLQAAPAEEKVLDNLLAEDGGLPKDSSLQSAPGRLEHGDFKTERGSSSAVSDWRVEDDASEQVTEDPLEQYQNQYAWPIKPAVLALAPLLAPVPAAPEKPPGSFTRSGSAPGKGSNKTKRRNRSKYFKKTEEQRR